MKSESEVAQLCPTSRSHGLICSPPGSSVHGIFQARVLEWGAIAFSGYTLYNRAIKSESNKGMKGVCGGQRKEAERTRLTAVTQWPLITCGYLNLCIYFNFYWSVVDLQSGVSFRYTESESVIQKHVHSFL